MLDLGQYDAVLLPMATSTTASKGDFIRARLPLNVNPNASPSFGEFSIGILSIASLAKVGSASA